VAAANVVLYTTFTINSILDPNLPEVTLAQNLPFHLCNLVAWALIPAYLFDWPGLTERLRAFCFFIGTLTGVLALASPVPIYIGRPVFSLPSLGFYGVHAMNAVLSVLLAALGLYQPRWRHTVRAVVHLALLTTLILPLDLVMRALVDPDTNYFYLFNPEGAGILIFLHDLVPIPYVYMLLATPLALGGSLLVMALFRAVTRLPARREVVATRTAAWPEGRAWPGRGRHGVPALHPSGDGSSTAERLSHGELRDVRATICSSQSMSETQHLARKTPRVFRATASRR